MSLAKYIGDLLFRYECVIVPNFGGFITNEISARINSTSHTFYAPSKQITFNAHLQSNDGLLANYIAASQNVSFQVALRFINEEVSSWKESLAKESLELENIGFLKLNNEGRILFERTNTVNFLSSSFGLNTYTSPAINRVAYKEQLKQLEANAPMFHSEENKRRMPAFIKYAATAAIIISLGTFGWNEYTNYQHNQLVAQAAQQQQKVTKSIQEATFVISNPLPTITLTIAKETPKYHIIAGAFRDVQNADSKLHELLLKGFDASIIGVNKWGLTQVAYQSFSIENDAINALHKIIRTENGDAWLMIEENK